MTSDLPLSASARLTRRRFVALGRRALRRGETADASRPVTCHSTRHVERWQIIDPATVAIAPPAHLEGPPSSR